MPATTTVRAPATMPSSEGMAGARALATLSRQLLKLQREFAVSKKSGNYAATTTYGLRVAVASADPSEVAAYMLNEMGIRAPVTATEGGMLVAFGRFNHHSHATILRALQGEFKVLSAMTEDGQQALKIYL